MATYENRTDANSNSPDNNQGYYFYKSTYYVYYKTDSRCNETSEICDDFRNETLCIIFRMRLYAFFFDLKSFVISVMVSARLFISSSTVRAMLVTSIFSPFIASLSPDVLASGMAIQRTR